MNKRQMIEKIERLLEIPMLHSFNNMNYSDIEIIYNKLNVIDNQIDNLQNQINEFQAKG